MRWFLATAIAIACWPASLAEAGACRDRPGILGTARTIAVDPAEHARIGGMQYDTSLPLADKEVVLTFDDGPLPPYTDRVLEILARECVQATFFVVGRMARAYPDAVRRIYNAGHTVGTHTENHPYGFSSLPIDRARREIDDGIASTRTALGAPTALAPFFRIPGLRRSAEVETVLAARTLMVWSADFPVDDWRGIGAAEVAARALDRLERKGKGIMLLHDIQPATVLALPHLLREMKARGYRIVHVVPAGPERPKTLTAPEQWVSRQSARGTWPRIAAAAAQAVQLPAPSRPSFGWPEPFRALASGVRSASQSGGSWPSMSLIGTANAGEQLPVASLHSFALSEAVTLFPAGIADPAARRTAVHFGGAGAP